jgi:hypothetical protein
VNKSIKSEKCAFLWFMLHNVITMHSAKNLLLTDGPSSQKHRQFTVTQEINYQVLRNVNWKFQKVITDT